MREIKFRGRWYKPGHGWQWVYGYLTGEDHIHNDEGFWGSVKKGSVGQYTGLKDMNGVEIYEGDICDCKEFECCGKAQWSEDQASFFFLVLLEDGSFEEERFSDYVDKLEVIGNIHENPELLEVTNHD